MISPQVSTPTPSQLPTYGNGPVLSAPQVIPVYWGTFAAGQVASMQAYMTGLTDYLTNSGETTVRQYGVNSASVVASYSDPFVPVSSIARGDVENEIRALISAGSVPAPGAQTVYMVMTGGIAFNDGYGSSYCGYHQYAHPGALASGPSFAYALNPNPYTTNCGEGGWDGLSQVQAWEGQISHELQEAATDPQPFSGWTPEIGDPCNWGNDPTNVTAMGFGAVQKVVDARYSSCSNWSPACTKNGCGYFTPTPSAITLVADGPAVGMTLTPTGGYAGSYTVWGLPPGNQVNFEVLENVGAYPILEFTASSSATPGTLAPLTVVGWGGGATPKVTYTAQVQITIQPCEPAASTCGAANGPQCGDISLGCGITADCGSCAKAGPT